MEIPVSTLATAFLPGPPLPCTPLPERLRTAPTCMRAGPLSRRQLLAGAAAAAIAAACRLPAHAVKPEGVNRPELLPKEFTPVLDLERFLTSGERAKLAVDLMELEKRTGFKVRVLTQRFPQTPGLAVRDYWGVDDKTVVMVADYFGGTGNLLKFNVGEKVYDKMPPRFWSLLSSRLGNTFYLREHGEDVVILTAVKTIERCLEFDGCVEPVIINAK